MTKVMILVIAAPSAPAICPHPWFLAKPIIRAVTDAASTPALTFAVGAQLVGATAGLASAIGILL